MKEIAEFRVSESFAHLLFGDSEGQRVGTSVRRVRVDTRSERFARIGELQQECRLKYGRPFFFGWDIQRRYSTAELKAARLFTVHWSKYFEPSGEECGTWIDESNACRFCGVGYVQRGPLVLEASRLPRGDFAKTIAREAILSGRATAILHEHVPRDIVLEPIRFRRFRREAGPWHQLKGSPSIVRIGAQTRAGSGPFESNPEDIICPYGHVLGLNLLSEVSVESATYTGADVAESEQYIGTRRGLVRPERVMFVSPRVREIVLTNRLKGWTFEVAHLV